MAAQSSLYNLQFRINLARTEKKRFQLNRPEWNDFYVFFD